MFGLACTTRKDYKSTIKKGNTCQFKIKLKGNGKTISATATAKVGSNKITIKTKKLTKKTVAKKTFKSIRKKTVIKVPKSKYKAYKKVLRARGLNKKVKIKK